MTVTKRQMQCYTLFEAQAYPPESAAAWVGNFVQEVGQDLPSAFRSHGLDHGSEGIEQWRLERLDNYKAFVRRGHPSAGDQELEAWYGNMALQVRYAALECARDYPSVEAQLRKGGDVGALTELICWHVERPNVRYANIQRRIAAAKAVFNAVPHLGVASELTAANKTVAAHKTAATGGAVIAVAGAGGSMGLVASHVAWHMPTWGWLALAAGGLIMVAGVLSLLTNSVKGAAVKSALVAATPPVPMPPATPAPTAPAPAAPAVAPAPPSTPAPVAPAATPAA